jgi:hypothetical protein
MHQNCSAPRRRSFTPQVRYGVFHYLDERISDEAKKAVSKGIQQKRRCSGGA